ncbi:unnamed protein product [Ectocarpus sp. 12 AP-2014]
MLTYATTNTGGNGFGVKAWLIVSLFTRPTVRACFVRAPEQVSKSTAAAVSPGTKAFECCMHRLPQLGAEYTTQQPSLRAGKGDHREETFREGGESTGRGDRE